MVAVCSAYGCTNHSNKNQIYHITTALKRDKWYPTPASYLCSEHFTEKGIYKTNNQRLLLESAVPTEFSFPEHIKKNIERPLPKRSFPAESHKEPNEEPPTKR
ncbi:hypothetical protein PR048_020021, partial [Dryococelus australis]